MEIAELDGNFYVLVNYGPEAKEAVRAIFQKHLLEFKTSLAALGLLVTFGCGTESPSLGELHHSLAAARAAVDDRILQGTGQMIEREAGTSRSLTGEERFLRLHKKLVSHRAPARRDGQKSVQDLKEELLEIYQAAAG